MISFRADGNPQVGLGHVMRCLSLADAFQDMGRESIFIVASEHMKNLIQSRGFPCHVLHTEYRQMEQELELMLHLLKKEKPEMLVLDSYFVTSKYMSTLKQEVPLVYIDDMNAFDYPVDAVLNYNIYAEDMDYPPGKKYLLGPRYAPLRKEFQNLGRKEIRTEVKDILLLTGGTDLEHVVLRVLAYLKENLLSTKITLHVVLGAMNQDIVEIERVAESIQNVRLYRNVSNIRELMQRCDVAVSAAGTTLYELCACGVPTVTYILADNQIVPAKAFKKAGLMKCAGDVRRGNRFITKLDLNLNYLLQNWSERIRIAERMQNSIDGFGAEKACIYLVKALSVGDLSEVNY